MTNMTDDTQENKTTQPQETPEAEEPKEEPYRTPFGGFIYHQRLAAEKAIKALSSLVPPDFKQYSREAKKEYLLSFKVLIEGIADSISREMNRARGAQEPEDKGKTPPSTTGKSKVKVEVS